MVVKNSFIKIVYIFGTCFLAIIIPLILFISIVDPNGYKEALSDKITDTIGRKVLINGPISLTFNPDLNLHIENISIANQPTFESGNFAYLKGFDISIGLLPILKGTLQIERVKLDQLSVNLIEENSKNNWQFSINDKDEEGSDTLLNYVIHSIIINQAQISYKHLNHKSGYKSKPFNLKVNPDSQGEISFKDNKLKFVNTQINLANILNTKINGQVNFESELTYQANFVSGNFSLIKLAELVNISLPKTLIRPIYKSLKLSATIFGTKDKIQIEKVKLNSLHTKLNGNITANLTSLKLNQHLTINNLEVSDFFDLDGYKLKINKLTIDGDLNLAKTFLASSLNGREDINANDIILYGFAAREFTRQVNQATKQISSWAKIVSYTQTKQTIKQLKSTITELNSHKAKNVSQSTNLGNFNSRLVFTNGVLIFQNCKLKGNELIAYCGGGINFTNQTINFMAQARLLAEGKQFNLINFLFFPFYVKGNYTKPETGVDWPYIIKETTRYYQTSSKDRPLLNKLVEAVTSWFSTDPKK